VEEVETTLFGVVRGVFTGVEPRHGLIERADGGVLYLDELPNLPLRVQRSLLRFAEDGEYAPIGETRPRRANVRLVLGSNRRVGESMLAGELASDLVARMHRVELPPLAERRADLPAICGAVFEDAFARGGLRDGAWRELLGADAMEALALHDYRGVNVRLLQDLAAATVARVCRRPPAEWAEAFGAIVARYLPDSPVLARGRIGTAAEPSSPAGRPSVYESHRDEIIATYRSCGGNLSAMETALGASGVTVHRRWLAEFLDRWGVRRRRGRSAAD
jgi:DNA-binding NtrC family response regulator